MPGLRGGIEQTRWTGSQRADRHDRDNRTRTESARTAPAADPGRQRGEDDRGDDRVGGRARRGAHHQSDDRGAVRHGHELHLPLLRWSGRPSGSHGRGARSARRRGDGHFRVSPRSDRAPRRPRGDRRHARGVEVVQPLPLPVGPQPHQGPRAGIEAGPGARVREGAGPHVPDRR